MKKITITVITGTKERGQKKGQTPFRCLPLFYTTIKSGSY